MTYRVYNHNDTLLGEFDTAADAYAEAEFYMDQTGNHAYVRGKAIGYQPPKKPLKKTIRPRLSLC